MDLRLKPSGSWLRHLCQSLWAHPHELSASCALGKQAEHQTFTVQALERGLQAWLLRSALMLQQLYQGLVQLS